MTDCSCVIEVLTEGPQGPAGAPGEPIIAMVGDDTDIGAGGWWVTRDYHAAATMNYLRAEVLAGVVEWPADTDGWQWFDSEPEARAAYGLPADPSDLEMTDASD